MTRTYVVTGAASGIGKATSELLVERGHRVIGVDLHDANVTVDLATEQGRADLVDGVREASEGAIDAIVANAGLATPNAATVAVNYFGTLATLTGLRPLLARIAGTPRGRDDVHGLPLPARRTPARCVGVGRRVRRVGACR